MLVITATAKSSPVMRRPAPPHDLLTSMKKWLEQRHDHLSQQTAHQRPAWYAWRHHAVRCKILHVGRSDRPFCFGRVRQLVQQRGHTGLAIGAGDTDELQFPGQRS